MLKVTESIMTKLYKTTMYSVDLGMFRVEASMAVPEDYSQDRLFEFGLNDKKEFNVTFDLEVKSFMPVFENGILLTEVSEMAKQSTGQGIGLFRTGPNGEIGIQFGGIFQKFEYTIEDIKKAPTERVWSNGAYVNPDSIKTGGPYIETTTDSAPVAPEASESKEYRNAEGDEG